MGNWDSIYRNFQKGGDAWATLSEGIDPRFANFIEKTTFPIRRALDIGCGTGKYLSYLESKDFVVDGIDSSPTAVEMTKKMAIKHCQVQLADMYDFSYPKNTYDLILSISTLHHGSKSQVRKTVLQIYDSLVPSGMIFITLPNVDASNTALTSKDYIEIEPGTYSPNFGPEKGIPHSFFTEEEIYNLFSQFKVMSLDLDQIGRWFIVGEKK